MSEQVVYILEQALRALASLFQIMVGVKELAYKALGMPGVYAFYVVCTVLLLLLAAKVLKLLFDVLRYLVLPAIALALLATWLFPVSFAVSLPVCAVGCSVILLLKS